MEDPKTLNLKRMFETKKSVENNKRKQLAEILKIKEYENSKNGISVNIRKSLSHGRTNNKYASLP